MVICADSFEPAAPFGIGDGEAGFRSPEAPGFSRIDWKAPYGRERARADAAEARCGEFRRAGIEARSKAGSYGSLHERGRAKLEAARAELKDVRRASRTAPGLQAEVERLRKLPAAAGVDSRQRTTNASLRMEVGRLGSALGRRKDRNRKLRGRVRALERRHRKRKRKVREPKAGLEGLRSTTAVLSRDRYGTRSERRDRKPSGRKRGQQRDNPGHGRTGRTNPGRKEERHEPPGDPLTCPCCGAPFVGNGEHESELAGIHVRAHIRQIRRPRYRRTCGCPSTPAEVTAPPQPRLFGNTGYGTSVWGLYPYGRFVAMRPARRVAAWLTDHGLAMSPGTPLGGTERMLAPLAAAVFSHLNRATVRHADGTGWRIQELGRNGKSRRAWLWSSLCGDAVFLHVDPAGGAEAAAKLFADVDGPVFLVCDRHSAYRKLARSRPWLVLSWCWAHLRRDCIKCAAGHRRLEPWRNDWIQAIGAIYHPNGARLEHLDAGADTPAFRAARARLESAVAGLFAKAGRELAALADDARQRGPPRPLINHRAGLALFPGHPRIPMDSNVNEAIQRSAAIGRKPVFGSDSLEGARLTAVMYTVFRTLAMNRIDVRRWLAAR